MARKIPFKLYRKGKELYLSSSLAKVLGKPELKLIEVIIAECKNKSVSITTSYRELGKKAGLTSPNSIQTGFKKLKHLGFIEIKTEKGIDSIITVKAIAEDI